MRFMILRDEDQMSVDNATVPLDCSTLEPEVRMVVWNGDEGHIEYNDRPKVRMPINDVGEWHPWVNNFMRELVNATPPIQVEQARRLKLEMVEALYEHKRTLPYQIGTRLWECTDEAVAHMGAAIVTAGSSGVGANEINGALSTLTGQINGALAAETAQINASLGAADSNFTGIVNANNASAPVVNQWSGIMAQNHAGTSVFGNQLVFSGGYQSSTGSGGFGYMSAAGVGSVSGASVSGASVIEVPPPSISWQPLNAADLLSIPLSEFTAALRAILGRRNNVNRARLAHRSEINRPTHTSASLIDYDVTTDWPT